MVNNGSIDWVPTHQALHIYGILFNSHVKGWYYPDWSIGNKRAGGGAGRFKKLIMQGYITTEGWDQTWTKNIWIRIPHAKLHCLYTNAREFSVNSKHTLSSAISGATSSNSQPHLYYNGTQVPYLNKQAKVSETKTKDN